MINVSNEFKELMETRTNFKQYAQIKLDDGTVLALDETQFTASNNYIVDGAGLSTIPLGVAIQKNIQIEIINDEEQYSGYNFVGANIALYLNFELSSTTERINKGFYTVLSPATYGDTIIITAVDNMHFADIVYTPGITFPATAAQTLRDICDTCGIIKGNISFDNDSFTIPAAPEGTCRQIIGYIAMLACGNARINNEGALDIIPYDFTGFDTGNYVTLENFTYPKFEANDVSVTGVKMVVRGETSDLDKTVLVGTEGYVLTVENPLAEGQEDVLLTWIYETFSGAYIRPFSGDMVSNPLVEFMDLAKVVDRRGNVYNTIITDVNFQTLGYTTVKNSFPNAIQLSTTYSSDALKVEQLARKWVDYERQSRQEAITKLNNDLASSSGLYQTDVEQADGSTISYFHDKPTLEESKNVLKITAEAIGISNDGGTTYHGGFTFNAEAVLKFIETEGLEADWVKIGSKTVTTVISESEQSAKDYSDSRLADYENTVSAITSNLQAQIDGQIETHYYDYAPKLENAPASEWTTEEEREKHEGDLFFDRSTGYAYRFFNDNGTWTWTMLQDTDITKALSAAAAAQSTADVKRRVFVEQPTPPYDTGDLWFDGTDILTSTVTRASGSTFVKTDWVKKNSYTDDTAANQALGKITELGTDFQVLENKISSKVWQTDIDAATADNVQKVEVLYALSDSATIAPESGWDTTAPAWIDGKFMWQKTVTTSADGTEYVSAITCIAGATGATGPQGPQGEQGVQGEKGDTGDTGPQGDAGKGIKSIANYYLATASSSGITTATTGWTTTIQTITATNKYLWNYEVITYTDSTTTTTTPVIIGVYGNTGAQGEKGDTGDTGNGISSITEYYAVSTSNSTSPTSWQTTVPTLTTTNKYLWNYEVISYTDGTTKETAKRVIGVYGNTGAQGVQGEKGDTGDTGGTGERGTGILKITTAPTAYTTATGGFTPSYRIALSTVKSQSGVSSVLVGDVLQYSYYQYKVGYVDSSYVYTAARTSIRGATGAQGAQGAQGETGVGVSAIVTQYYISTSSTTQTGGSWKTTQDGWSASQYLWTRSAITWTDGTTTYTDPVLASTLNTLRSEIDQQVGSIALSVKSSSGTTSLKLTDGTLDLTGYATFTDLSTSGKTTINGSNITTGTLDASKAIVTNLNASNINSGTLSADLIDVSSLMAKDLTATGKFQVDNGDWALTQTTNGLQLGRTYANYPASYAYLDIAYGAVYLTAKTGATMAAESNVFIEAPTISLTGDVLINDTALTALLAAKANKTRTVLGSFSTESTLETALTEIMDGMLGGQEEKIVFTLTPLSSYGFSGTISKTSSGYGFVSAKNGQGNIGGSIFKYCYNGTWLPVEWENPPLNAGMEYRTTERWYGSPVYKKCVTYTTTSALSGTTGFSVPHGISNLSWMIDVEAVTNGYFLPYNDSSGTLAVRSWNSTNVVVGNAGTSWSSGRAWYFTFKYTKS